MRKYESNKNRIGKISNSKYVNLWEYRLSIRVENNTKRFIRGLKKWSNTFALVSS